MGLDAVEVVMAIEEHFGISLSDADAARCVTPAILIDLVLAKVSEAPLGKSGDRIWTRPEVASDVKMIVIEQLGLKEKQYWEEARFIEDFGID